MAQANNLNTSSLTTGNTQTTGMGVLAQNPTNMQNNLNNYQASLDSQYRNNTDMGLLNMAGTMGSMYLTKGMGV